MHTKDGVAINVGDTLNVPVKVLSVQSDAEYCNVSVETVEPMFPSNTPTTITLNTKQLVARQVTHGPGPGPDPSLPADHPLNNGGTPVELKQKLKGFGILDVEAYAKKAIHVLQRAGDSALIVIEAGFKMYAAFTDRDLSGILQAFQEAQGNVQKVIDAIREEFGD